MLNLTLKKVCVSVVSPGISDNTCFFHAVFLPAFLRFQAALWTGSIRIGLRSLWPIQWCELRPEFGISPNLSIQLWLQDFSYNFIQPSIQKHTKVWTYDVWYVCLSLLVFETGVWDIFETLHVARSLAQLVGIRRKTCCDFVPNVASKEFLGVRKSLSLQYYNVEVKLICVRRKCDVWRCTMFDSCRTSHSSTLLIFSHLLSFMPINSAEFSWGYLLCSLFVAGACLHQPGALQQTIFVNQQFYANIHIHE